MRVSPKLSDKYIVKDDFLLKKVSLELTPPHFGTTYTYAGYKYFYYNVGWNISDSKAKSLCRSNREIHHGIHLYRFAVSAKDNTCGTDRFVVKFRVNKSDVIGVSHNQIVAKKVFLEKEEYQRVLELYAKRMNKD